MLIFRSCLLRTAIRASVSDTRWAFYAVSAPPSIFLPQRLHTKSMVPESNRPITVLQTVPIPHEIPCIMDLVGFEPTTFRLQGGCSPSELQARMNNMHVLGFEPRMVKTSRLKVECPAARRYVQMRLVGLEPTTYRLKAGYSSN